MHIDTYNVHTVADDERAVPVAIQVCAQEHERYYPTPPHPTPPQQ